MSTDKEKYAAAKSYLKAGDTEAARRLLKQVDHPAAQKLLKTLPPEKRNYLRLILIVLVILGIILAIIRWTAFNAEIDAIKDMMFILPI